MGWYGQGSRTVMDCRVCSWSFQATLLVVLLHSQTHLLDVGLVGVLNLILFFITKNDGFPVISIPNVKFTKGGIFK